MTTNRQPQEGEKTPTAHTPDNGAPDAGDKAIKARKAPSAFRTISEVADELGVQQHVLRFWETKFTQVKPLKRGGGRRYYRPEDVTLLKKIHHLLYTEGYTIKGVQKLLKGQGKQQIVAGDIAATASGGTAANESRGENRPVAPNPAPKAEGARAPREALSDRQRVILESMLGELKELRTMIKGK